LKKKKDLGILIESEIYTATDFINALLGNGPTHATQQWRNLRFLCDDVTQEWRKLFLCGDVTNNTAGVFHGVCAECLQQK
jgi:hypothetical protein